MNQLDIVVFDFETGGLKPSWNEAISVAGKAYNARTLEPYPIEQGGEFNSLMKPLHFDRLEEGALRVNRIKVSDLEKAPDQKIVWNQFVAWVGRYKKNGTKYGAPIACGKNIRSFDLLFADELNKLHCPKKEKTILFNCMTQLDIQDDLWRWFENETEPEDLKMDTLRPWLGLSSEHGHEAITDVRQTGEIMIKFLKLYRELQKRVTRDGKKFIQFKGSFNKQCTA